MSQGLTIRGSAFAVVGFAAGLLAGAFVVPPRYDPVEDVSVYWTVRAEEPFVVLQFGLERVEVSPERAEQVGNHLLECAGRAKGFRERASCASGCSDHSPP